jgi:hypothetical protein
MVELAVPYLESTVTITACEMAIIFKSIAGDYLSCPTPELFSPSRASPFPLPPPWLETKLLETS